MPHLLDVDSRVDVLTRSIEDVLLRAGAGGLTLRALATASGISTSSMLHHFGSRDQMLGVCAHQSLRARSALLVENVIDVGPLALLPGPEDDPSLRGTRTWVGWHELWRVLPRLGDTILATRAQERAVLAQALDHQVPRTDVPGLHAVLDGLRIAVTLPGGALPIDDARRLLAHALSRASGLDITNRAVVPRDVWAWPLIAGPKAVAGSGGP